MFIKPDRIILKGHSTLNERWVQARIEEDPGLLGLGELVLRDRERRQPGGGRLDLLLQHAETDRRYEVELQLGSTDESHIIRTIEYWDIERKRYPQYEHCAVIVAEDITARFLNVISLFNGSVPLIAIQMRALSVSGDVALVFTTVLDELTRGPVDEDEELSGPVDRAYWERRASAPTMATADELIRMTQSINPTHSLAYGKGHIGLIDKNGTPDHRIRLIPQKRRLRLRVLLQQSSEIDARLDAAGLDYDAKPYRYRLRLSSDDVIQNDTLLRELLEAAFKQDPIGVMA